VDVAKSLAPNPTKTFPADNPVERLDYVFVTPTIQLVKYQVLETLASDHRPLFVCLETG
jgi:endonuclease/exonuclease/phosphatase (EEP) superfamily protein YafD